MGRLFPTFMIIFCLGFAVFSIWCLTWVDETWAQAIHVTSVAAQIYFAGFWLNELITGD